MKNKLTISFILILFIAIIHTSTEAATIVLKSGVTMKGKLIDRSEDEITVQDPETKQMRIIKTVFIRDLVLEPSEQKIKERKKKGKDLMLRGTDAEEPSLVSIIQPTMGILPGIAYPFGKLGTKLNLGYGGHLFFDLGIPMKPEVFKIRFGLSAGCMYHQTKSTKAASNLIIVPIVIYTKLQFISAVGVRPYIKLGGGITPIFGGGSSFDPTVAVGLGLGYVNSKIPFMEFFIEAGMMMAFEKVRGDFITASVGVAYRFGAARI